MASRASKRPSNSRSKGFSRTLIALLVFATAVVSLVVLSLGNTNSSSRVQASTTMANQKHYKGTRPIVVDRQTGQRRLPTQEEADQAAASLSELAKRPESLPQVSAPAGGVAVDLQGGFGGVMLARPNEDGTWEIRCVFTFEEGIEFLGLVKEFQ